jgi:hypothetical protein
MSHDPRSVRLARHLSTEHAATRTYTGSPLARWNIATASPAPQRGYHGATTRLLRELLRGYYEATTRLLRGYYEATTRLLRDYYEATTRPLPDHYQATMRLPRGYYQEPHARHSASSTAAAAPLVCRRRSRQQLGAGADDPHTNGKISRRPFSTCRTSWTTPKTKHANLLVQQDAAGVQPSLHSDLADEDEHVKRAGLGQVEHDGAVHDRQAPTPASSNHVACAGQHPVAP